MLTELKASDDSKAVVRYAKHPLDIDEVREHIAAGKRPTRLAMTWEDRVSFELTEGMQLRNAFGHRRERRGLLVCRPPGNKRGDERVPAFAGSDRLAAGRLYHAWGGVIPVLQTGEYRRPVL